MNQTKRERSMRDETDRSCLVDLCRERDDGDEDNARRVVDVRVGEPQRTAEQLEYVERIQCLHTANTMIERIQCLHAACKPHQMLIFTCSMPECTGDLLKHSTLECTLTYSNTAVSHRCQI